MKKIIISAVFVLGALFSQSLFAQMKYLEGRDYFVMEKPLPLQKTGEKEVLEFFSYACPHCATLNPMLMDWAEKRKPADVGFYHMPALGGSWSFVGRVKFTADELELGHEFDQAYFDAIHNDRKRNLMGDRDAAFAMMQKFTNVGVAEIEKAWNSLPVKNKMRKSIALWQQSGLAGVPALVVNGKYIVKSDVGPIRMFEVVDFLLETTKP